MSQNQTCFIRVLIILTKYREFSWLCEIDFVKLSCFVLWFTTIAVCIWRLYFPSWKRDMLILWLTDPTFQEKWAESFWERLRGKKTLTAVLWETSFVKRLKKGKVSVAVISQFLHGGNIYLVFLFILLCAIYLFFFEKKDTKKDTPRFCVA